MRAILGERDEYGQKLECYHNMLKQMVMRELTDKIIHFTGFLKTMSAQYGLSV